VSTPGWVRRLRHPPSTVRLRLTLLYGGLFLVCGAGLLAITYTLVDNAGNQSGPSAFIGPFNQPDKVNPVFPGQTRSAGPHQTLNQSKKPADKRATLPPPIRQLLRSAKGANAVRVVVRSQQLADEHQLIVESAIALAIMAIISTLLGWFVAGRALRPLRVMTTATHEISAASLHQRLNMPGPRDELRALADTIDGLLGRLERSFAAQRRFVMNASHELRTPLTAVRALLEMVLTDPDATVETYREACHQVLEENHQQEELIEALLALAQGQRGITRRETIDLVVVVAAGLDATRSRAAARSLEVAAELEPAALAGDQRLIARLVSNLLVNAVVHNVDGGRVSVAVGTVGGEAMLSVTNTGTEVPADQIGRLLEPFQRLAPDRVGPGLGLGLSIVQAIADAHDADLVVRPADGGGLTVVVRFASALDAIEPAYPDGSEPVRTRAPDRVSA
jgi:signal transduction histidine kinase